MTFAPQTRYNIHHEQEAKMTEREASKDGLSFTGHYNHNKEEVKANPRCNRIEQNLNFIDPKTRGK